MSTSNRFIQRPYGRVIASAPLPAQSAFNASMVAQASRVPRLANLTARTIGRSPPKGRR